MKVAPLGGSGSRPMSSPATLGLVVAIVVAFFVNWSMMPTQPLFQALAWSPESPFGRPWTFLTYAFAQSGNNIIGVAFSALWLWMIGGQVERDLRMAWYLGAFFVFTLIGGVLMAAGSYAIGVPMLAGTAIPVGAITMLWGARNKSQQIYFFGVIPMTAQILCVITGVMVLLTHGLGSPFAGVLALIPLALAWLWADGKLPVSFGPRQVSGVSGISAAEKRREQARFSNYIDEVRDREKAREERDKLRDLFERSLIEDPDDPKGSGEKGKQG